MIEEMIEELATADPFLPFQIRLVNGDVHLVFRHTAVAVLEGGVYIRFQDEHWVQFPFQSVASCESLVAQQELNLPE